MEQQGIEHGALGEKTRPLTPLEHELDVVLTVTRSLMSVPAAARERVLRYVTDLTESAP